MIQFVGIAGTIFALEIYTVQAVRGWWTSKHGGR